MIGHDNASRRDAWVRQALASIPRGSRLLDAGAGSQRYRIWCQHLQYVAQDFGGYDGKGDGRGLQTEEYDYGQLDIICDITAIPVADASFDAVLCTEVLEHVPHPRRALDELARVLRPRGILILTAPFSSLTHYAPYHFCTGFNRYYYEHHLGGLGFELLEVSPNGGYFDLLAQEIARVGSVAHQYTGARPGIVLKVAQRMLRWSLARCRKADRGSAELGCFGYHVRARKLPVEAVAES